MFDFTKPIFTKVGNPVRILCTDAPGSYPIVGLVQSVISDLRNTGNFAILQWTMEGMASSYRVNDWNLKPNLPKPPIIKFVPLNEAPRRIVKGEYFMGGNGNLIMWIYDYSTFKAHQPYTRIEESQE